MFHNVTRFDFCLCLIKLKFGRACGDAFITIAGGSVGSPSGESGGGSSPESGSSRLNNQLGGKHHYSQDGSACVSHTNDNMSSGYGGIDGGILRIPSKNPINLFGSGNDANNTTSNDDTNNAAARSQ